MKLSLGQPVIQQLDWVSHSIRARTYFRVRWSVGDADKVTHNLLMNLYARVRQALLPAYQL